MKMNIFVLLKEPSIQKKRLTLKMDKFIEGDAEFIINPYDEYAVEEAIVLKEKHGGEVTVVSVWDEELKRHN